MYSEIIDILCIWNIDYKNLQKSLNFENFPYGKG